MGNFNVSTVATFDWKKLLPLCYNDVGLVFQSILRLTKLFVRNLLPGHAMQSVARGPGFDTWSSHKLSFLLSLIQEGGLSVTGKSMCTKV